MKRQAGTYFRDTVAQNRIIVQAPIDQLGCNKVYCGRATETAGFPIEGEITVNADGSFSDSAGLFNASGMFVGNINCEGQLFITLENSTSPLGSFAPLGKNPPPGVYPYSITCPPCATLPLTGTLVLSAGQVVSDSLGIFNTNNQRLKCIEPICSEGGNLTLVLDNGGFGIYITLSDIQQAVEFSGADGTFPYEIICHTVG